MPASSRSALSSQSVSAAALIALLCPAVNQPQVHVPQLLQLQPWHWSCSRFGMCHLLLLVLLLLLLPFICSTFRLDVAAAAAAAAALAGHFQAVSCSWLSWQVLLQLRHIHCCSR
jgi:hypothetical protein